MRYHYLPYFLLMWLCCWAAWAGAQTPYDSFAPEMSRPILDKDSVDAWRKEQQMLREQEQTQRQQETMARLQQEPLFVAFDMRQQMCYLLDTAMQVLAYSPIPEDVQRWLSVDPLADQYIHQSPYLYCNGNPIMFIDPDGMAPSDEEAAWMAEYAYGDKAKNKNQLETQLDRTGWKVSNFNTSIKMDKSANGFQSILFERDKGDAMEYAYVFAGTDKESLADIAADAGQIWGLSSQYSMAIDNARTLSNEMGGAELTFVGHSLGGGEATAASMATGRAAITFNPAAISIYTFVGEGLFINRPNIKNHVVVGDFVNTAQILANPLLTKCFSTYLMILPGKTQLILPKSGNTHSMQNFIKWK